MSFKSARLGSGTLVNWPQHEDTLRRMWREGAPVKAIAAAIPNGTVDGVARHAKRLNLGPHPLAAKYNTPAENGRLGGRARAAAMRETRDARDAELNITRTRTAQALGRSLRKPEPPPPPLPSPKIIPPAKTCQWPLTDGRPWRFCDAPSEVQSYCAEHHKLGHVDRA